MKDLRDSPSEVKLLLPPVTKRELLYFRGSRIQWENIISENQIAITNVVLIVLAEAHTGSPNSNFT